MITHAGRHHTDEMMALALVRLRFGSVKLVRSADPELQRHADILLDCGGTCVPARGRFDHHSNSAIRQTHPSRPNGYATAGLVWREYGEVICLDQLAHYPGSSWESFRSHLGAAGLETLARALANRIDQDILIQLDLWDTGIYPASTQMRQWLPLQWLIPHLEFEAGSDALGRALLARLRTLAENFVDEWKLAKDLRQGGATEFWLAGNGVVVLAPPGQRVEATAARRVVQAALDLPLVGLISSLRHGTRYVALLAARLPDHVAVPAEIEYTPGRKNFYHDDRWTLLRFIRQSLPQQD